MHTIGWGNRLENGFLPTTFYTTRCRPRNSGPWREAWIPSAQLWEERDHNRGAGFALQVMLPSFFLCSFGFFLPLHFFIFTFLPLYLLLLIFDLYCDSAMIYYSFSFDFLRGMLSQISNFICWGNQQIKWGTAVGRMQNLPSYVACGIRDAWRNTSQRRPIGLRSVTMNSVHEGCFANECLAPSQCNAHPLTTKVSFKTF